MTVSSVTSSSAAASASTDSSTLSSFRTADFLKVMLSELSHQDPMSPQDTGKIVENMQKLQELANTQYTKFRSDVTWAQNLMGKPVTVQQQALSDSEKESQINSGLVPDIGYGNKTGTISSFRVVGEAVYVKVGDYDYPIDNVKQISAENDPGSLSSAANQLLGRQVSYLKDASSSTNTTSIVTGVDWNTDGTLRLTMKNGDQVPYAHLTSISIPSGANST
jgi:hypothetical protein